MSARTAVKTIQAAIEHMEALRRLVDPAPLVRWRDQEHIQGWDGFIVIGDSAEEGDECNPVARVYTEELADLIVTLHRTIDAQLAILRDAVSRAAVDLNPAGIPIHYRHAINLASSILGEES